MTNPVNTADAFMCRYWGYYHSESDSADSTIGFLSTCGYWELFRVTGTSNVKVRLFWDNTGCGVFDTTNLCVANWNGNIWKDLGNDSISGNKFSGSIYSHSNVVSYNKLVWAQQTPSSLVIATTSNTTRLLPEDIFGYNGNNTIQSDLSGNPMQSWDILGTSQLLNQTNINLMRLPAGTMANYTDWKTGYPIIEKDLPYNWFYEIQSYRKKMNRTGNEYYFAKQNLDLLSARPILVWNLLTSSFQYEAASVFRINEVNLPCQFIELGNEFYLSDQQYKERFPTVLDYVQNAENWAGDYKNLNIPHHTGLKIAIVGAVSDDAGRGRGRLWLKKVLGSLSSSTSIDAITIHDYITESGALCSLNPLGNPAQEQLMTLPFKSRDEIKLNTFSQIQQFNQSHNPLEIWMTEFNLNDQDDQRVGTWMHGLINATMALTYLETPEVTRIISHTMFSDGRFGNIFESNDGFSKIECHGLPGGNPTTRTGEFTALGTSLNLVAKALRNATDATLLNFPGALMLRDDNNLPSGYSSLYGWQFNNTVNNKMSVILLNLSGSVQTIDVLTNLFPGSTSQDITVTALEANNVNYAIVGNPSLSNPSSNNDELRFYSPWRTIAGGINVLKIRPFSMILLELDVPYVYARLTDEEICTGSTTSLIVESNDLSTISTTTITYTPSNNGLNITDNVTNNLRKSFVVEAVTPGTYTISPCPTCPTVSLTVHQDIQDLQISSSNYSINSNKIMYCPGANDIELAASCTSSYPSSPLTWIWTPAIDSGYVASVCSNSPFCDEITLRPFRTTHYTVYVTDQHCWKSKDIEVQLPIERLSLGDPIRVCDPTVVNLTADFIAHPDYSDVTFSWSLGNNTWTTNQPTIGIDHSYLATGLNVVNLTVINPDNNESCNISTSLEVYKLSCCAASNNGPLLNPVEVTTNEPYPLYFNHALNLANACSLQTGNYNVVFTGGANNKTSATITCTQNSPPITINGDFKILSDVLDPNNGTILLDGLHLTLIGCTLNLGSQAQIELLDNRKLILQDCYFNACANDMWKGITADKKKESNPPELTMRNCNIMNAEHAVSLTRESIYRIIENTFIDNYIDLSIYNDNTIVVAGNALDFEISGNTFTRGTGSLLPPYSFQDKFAAIKLDNTDRPRIGNDNSINNIINNSLYGVYITNSGAEIYNTDFSDLIFTSGTNNNTNGTAIFLNNQLLHWDRLLRVGRYQNPNTFKSCKNGVWGTGEADYRIQFNTFGNNNTSQADDVSNTCINIENSSDNEIEIGTENKFYAFNKGIFLYNLGQDVTLNINSNKFWDAVWGTSPATRYSSTAISIMNPMPVIYKTQALVEENRIGTSSSPNHARIGISVFQAGNVKVAYNEIYFHYNSTTYPFFRGIQLINSQDCRINRNTTIENSNYVQGLNAAVVGIQVQESVTPSVNCNEPEGMGYGMHFIGKNGAVTMVDNLFSTYDRGISLGINSSLTGYIGQVQGSQNPSPQGTGYMNTWVDQSSDRVEGFTMQPIDWYYGGPQSFSNQDAPLKVNGSPMQLLTSRSNADEGNDCSMDAWYLSRISGYAGLAFDSIRFEGSYSEQDHYGHKNSFYKFFAADTSRLEGTGSDTIYRHVYNQINVSNIGKYQQVIQKTSGRSYAEAYALLETIEDTNYYETQLRTVLALYLNRILNDSVLSAEDTAMLTEIAYQNYLIGGEAVYLARAILRLEIEDGPIGEARLKKLESSVESRYFNVSPNPATESLNLDYNQEEKVVRIEISDPSGRIYQSTGNIKTVLISEMKPGLYLITLYYTDGYRIMQKFIKIK